MNVASGYKEMGQGHGWGVTIASNRVIYVSDEISRMLYESSMTVLRCCLLFQYELRCCGTRQSFPRINLSLTYPLVDVTGPYKLPSTSNNMTQVSA